MKFANRTKWAAIFVALASAGFPASALSPEDVRWRTNLQEAAAAAVKVNKPILVEFWAKECAPCGAMDATVFSDERVASALNRMIVVRVDVDADPVTMRKYGVRGTPTLLLTDSYGNELFRYLGMVSLQQMLQLLDELPSDVTKINVLSAELARNKDDFRALVALGDALRAARLFRSSTDYYARALGTRDAERQPAARAQLLLAAGRNHLELKAAADARRMFERCVREHPGTPAAAEAARLLGEK